MTTKLVSTGVEFPDSTIQTSAGLSDAVSSTITANIGIGDGTLSRFTTGSWNTGAGHQSLAFNDAGGSNTAAGAYSLTANTTGGANTAVGVFTLRVNTIGGYNTAIGGNALENTTGDRNTALGHGAGDTITTGSDNISLGYDSNPTAATSTGQCTLGNTTITNLRCNDTSISSLSDERDKDNIVDIPLGLDFINTLRPVSFDWNRRDGSMEGKKDFGFIAQELKVAQDATSYAESMRLVSEENPDKLEADPMKVFPIMVKAIQELTAKVEELESQLNT